MENAAVNFQSSSEFKTVFAHYGLCEIPIFQSSSEFKMYARDMALKKNEVFQSSSEFKLTNLPSFRYGSIAFTFNPLLSLRR